MSKHMRLPNGFGQISKIKGQNLRNPYRVMVTVGTADNGRPICKLLKPKAYFPTYNDAYMALVKYHENPYNPDDHRTMKEIYDLWFEEYCSKGKSKSSIQTIEVAWDYCSAIYDMDARDVRVAHVKDCVYNGISQNSHSKDGKAPETIRPRIKMVISMVLNYALEYGWVDKNCARDYKVESQKASNKPHMAFSDEEMKKLWEHSDDPIVAIILIQCYSGWRPKELELLKLDNVDIENRTFTGGVKTDAGKQRTVPIHPKIFPLVLTKYKEAKLLGSDRLLNIVGISSVYPLDYNRYRSRFEKVIEKYGLNEYHRAHDPRKQFVTMLKAANADEYAIKRLAGHAITDVTESVYTERNIEWLRKELEKIP